MDRRLLDAAVSGRAAEITRLAPHDPAVLPATTPQGNTCLHIASIHGHEGFCKDVLLLDQSLPLLTAVNADGETPLLTAVTRGRPALASVLLRCCRDHQLSEGILKQDKHGCNALHHAIRRGYRTLALELIEAEPALSKAANKHDEAPMFIAAMRNFTDVFDRLLGIPDSAHSGAFGFNVLHAAVRNGNSASHGHVGVARELLKHCPDAPYSDAKGSTCLHIAVLSDQAEFLKFVLRSQQLQHVINMADNSGETALHLATAKKINMADNSGETALHLATAVDSKKEMVAALVRHQDIDVTVLNNAGNPAIRVVDDAASTSSAGASAMDRRLLEAAITGDAVSLKDLVSHDPPVLLGTTPQGNTCLHSASIHGHEDFSKDALALNPSLLAAVNSEGETPLLSAVRSGRVSLASVFLRCCRESRDQKLSEAILKQDKLGYNALHHAVRSGHRKLALELIEAEPALSQAVNKKDESPMFMAAMKNYENVFEKLLQIPDSAHGGSFGINVLHAAVRNGNSGMAKRIMETRPWLAREEENKGNNTPMHLALLWDRIDVLRVLLKHDRSLGYLVSTDDVPLLVTAAYRGHTGVAQELLKQCPDAPYCMTNGWTCLHRAVQEERIEFVEFVMRSPQLRKLVNMRGGPDGETALHLAVRKCNPKMVAALLLHQDRDVTVLNNRGNPATWTLAGATDHAKTLNWNEVSMLMSKAYPASTFNLHKQVKDEVTNLSRKDIKSLTQTYTGNTSLVAILIATITFAAAFTLPGGNSSDAGSEGLPIMARKAAFQAFLISDTLAMCSSLAVAFVCVIARWEDLEFLLYYRSFTKKLMWFAYMATTTAFATGLYRVLAPRVLWLAIVVCVLTGLLPILTKLLGEWPILKLRFRLGRAFRSEFFEMI